MKTRIGTRIPYWIVCSVVLLGALAAAPATANGPGKAVLLTPQGLVDYTRNPQFTWQAAANAEWYLVLITLEGATYEKKWVQDTQWTFPDDFRGGSFTWYVRTYGDKTMGPWSDPATFTLPVAVPGKVVLLAPAGKVLTRRPPFSWVPEDAATMYHVFVKRDGRYAFEVHLPGMAAEYTPPDRLADGAYAWWILASSPDGKTGWSDAMYFNVGRPIAPGPVTLLQPTGTISDSKPVFKWTGDRNAEEYHLVIRRDGTAHADTRVEDATEWKPDHPIPAGQYRYWMRGENPAENGPWSSGSFVLAYPGETAPDLLYPVGEVYPCYEQPWGLIWRDDGYATWARLQIAQGARVEIDTWVEFDNEDLGVLRLPDAYAMHLYFNLLDPGTYRWRLRTYRPGVGTGPWSAWATFQIDEPTGPPGSPTDLWVDDTFWPLTNQGVWPCSRPVFHWGAVLQATSYSLEVEAMGGTYPPQRYEGGAPFGWMTQVESATELRPGSYRFTVRAENHYGTAETVSDEFEVRAARGTDLNVSDVRLELVGNKMLMSAALRRNVYVYDVFTSGNDGPVLDRYVDLADEPETVREGRLELYVPGPVKAGNYTAWVRGYHAVGGHGVWSSSPPLEVLHLEAPVPLAPPGVITGARPAFAWHPASLADGYCLYVTRNGEKYVQRDVMLQGGYRESEEGNSFTESGTPMGWHGMEDTWVQTLPFAFPFYGTTYTEAYIRPNGSLSFQEPSGDFETDLEENRIRVPTVIVCGDSVQTTEGPNCDIFVTSTPDAFTVRWATTLGTLPDAHDEGYVLNRVIEAMVGTLPDNYHRFNYAVTLYPDGTARFCYGPGNKMEHDIGLCAGDLKRLHVSPHHRDMDMTYAPDIVLTPMAGTGWTPHWDWPNGTYTWWLQAYREGADKSAWVRGDDFIIDHFGP